MKIIIIKNALSKILLEIVFLIKITYNYVSKLEFINIKAGIKIMDKEYDVTAAAWEIYKKLYSTNIDNLIDNLKIIPKGRPFITTTFKYNGKESSSLDFSGETDFNFGDTKIWGLGRSHYDHFKKILEAEKHSKNIEILNKCRKFHHSELNISLMPKTGNLQSVKKGIGNDRLDVFICCLNEYYLQRNNFIFNYSSFENLPLLKSFLDLFHNVYEYCDAIYHIDTNLTHDLILSGGRSLNSLDRVIEYMKLANTFWAQKGAYIKSVTSNL